MTIINLQHKTAALPAKIEVYWFENPHIGLARTRFHRITIPLTPFDSGLTFDSQPTSTDIILDWYALNLDPPFDLDGMDLAHPYYPDAEGSVYMGCAHNWCDVKKLLITKMDDHNVALTVSLVVEFENERVAQNEPFEFTTTAEILISDNV